MEAWIDELTGLLDDKHYEELASKLCTFVSENSARFDFGADFTATDKANVASLVCRVVDCGSVNCIAAALDVVRLLSRDRTDVDELAAVIDSTCKCSGLDGSLASRSIDIAVPSLKTMSNLLYNSAKARLSFTRTGSLYFGELMRSISLSEETKQLCYSNLIERNSCLQCMQFSLRCAFILTALEPPLRFKAHADHGAVCIFNDHLAAAAALIKDPLEDCVVDLVIEILKTFFNIGVDLSTQAKTNVVEQDTVELLHSSAKSLRSLLLFAECAAGSARKDELDTHVIHMLTVMPTESYVELTPLKENGEPDLRLLDCLLVYLDSRLAGATTEPDCDQLAPVLGLLHRLARSDRLRRKYLRSKLLPPRKDVETQPEKGNETRHRIIKLMTSLSTSTKHLAAELLYELCKRNVDRLIKYTGFGNAAGMLSDLGLLGAEGDAPVEMSSDEDSDTEEYKAAGRDYNPVIGAVDRTMRVDPFAGMSDEQKEYEAERLANLLHELDRSGVIRPARVGEDGRAAPVEHVLELLEGRGGEGEGE